MFTSFQVRLQVGDLHQEQRDLEGGEVVKEVCILSSVYYTSSSDNSLSWGTISQSGNEKKEKKRMCEYLCERGGGRECHHGMSW